MRFLSTRRPRADKHPLENPWDIALMFVAIPGVTLVALLVWAA